MRILKLSLDVDTLYKVIAPPYGFSMSYHTELDSLADIDVFCLVRLS